MVLHTALQEEELRHVKVSNSRMVFGQVDPISWLKDNLTVDFVAGSEVMEIALSGDDAYEVAGIVNAVTRAYERELEREPLRTEITQLEEMSRKLGAELEVLNGELEAPPRVRRIEDAVPPLTRGSFPNLGR
jgi:hypothetical protein